MLRFAIARRVWFAFLVAAVSLTALTAASWQTVSWLIRASDWVAHTRQVTSEIERLRADLSYAETSQRGALLAPEGPYARSYEQAKTRLADDLDGLLRLTADNPSQTSRLKELRARLEKRLATADETLASRRTSGLTAAAARVQAGAGLKEMNDALEEIERVRSEEERLLRERSDTQRRRARATLWLILAFGASALLVAAWGTRRILEDLERRVELEEEIAKFFELSLDLMCIADFEGRFVRLNAAWEKLLGMPRSQLIGRPFLDFVHPEDREKTMAETARLRSGAPSIGFENRYKTADGWRLLRWTAAGSDETRQFYAVARDTTAERAAEELKLQVAHHVNHELRSPVATVYLALGLLRESMGKRTELEIASRATEHLKRMVDDLLDVTRSQTGKLRVAPEAVDLAPLVSDCVELARPAAARRGLGLASEVGAGLRVLADPTRLRQIVGNLVDNALKFTPSGGLVTVAAASSGREGFVTLSVSDTGPGIPPEDLERIFDRLYQTERTTSKGSQGLGLGLAICRELVERQGGRIWAQSRPGEGARFFVELPSA